MDGFDFDFGSSDGAAPGGGGGGLTPHPCNTVTDIVSAVQCSGFELTQQTFLPWSLALVGLLLAVTAMRHARKLLRAAK